MTDETQFYGFQRLSNVDMGDADGDRIRRIAEHTDTKTRPQLSREAAVSRRSPRAS